MKYTHVLVVAVLACAHRAAAQEATPDPAPAGIQPNVEPAQPPSERPPDEIAKLRDEVSELRDDVTALENRVDTLAPLTAKLTGYLDVGFYDVSGDGSGIRADIGNLDFPKYAYVGPSWVFMGDPLSTAINAHGDPATTGPSKAVTFDPIKSGGPSFILNQATIGLFGEVSKNLLFQAKIDFIPRDRDVSVPSDLSLGDYIDARLAYLEYRIDRPWMKLSLFAGKFDSVIGYEYRSQESPTRIEVTPSLICRYTCGYPVGLKARAQWLDQKLSLALAVTNGSQFAENFDFNDEIDTNAFKTLSGRLGYGMKGFELGVSGMFGAQDGQTSNSVYQYLYGADVHYDRDNFVFRAEIVKGRAQGKTGDSPASTPCDDAPCLNFNGAYALVAYRLTNIIEPYLRSDWRDALHRSGQNFVYISKVYRFTPGIHLNINANLSVKAEFTWNREYSMPQIPDNIFTSSLVAKF
ncbi:MAG TPA: outer membrane beta-barrel protein [Kofleriaceae bacterium]|jgi:hypothetical protein